MGLFQNTNIEGYLGDESGLTGEAAAIVFPKSPEEVQTALQSAESNNLAVSFQGARTGICGGAVPQGGLIVNFSCMNKALDFSYDPVSGTGTITVEAGFTLEHLEIALNKKQLDTDHFSETARENWNIYRERKEKLWFLPNPSEKTATLGGIVCTAAGGSHAGIHIAPLVQDVMLILPDGQLLPVKHADKYMGGTPVPDAVEAICGSEGIYGAVISITLVLHTKPREQYGLLAFFSAYSQIPLFMEKLETALKMKVSILSTDFFDSSCAAFAEEAGKTLEELGRYPLFPTDTAAALWLELGGEEAPLFTALEAALAALEETGAMADTALAATEQRDFERLERLRHLLTEAANLADRRRPLVLADITVPRTEWLEIIQCINSTLKQTGLIYTLMGHFLWNTVSLRFPGAEPSAADVLGGLLKKIRQCRCEGDHGIGRVKKNQFRLLNIEKKSAILKIKKKIDPAGRINPEILLDS